MFLFPVTLLHTMLIHSPIIPYLTDWTSPMFFSCSLSSPPPSLLFHFSCSPFPPLPSHCLPFKYPTLSPL